LLISNLKKKSKLKSINADIKNIKTEAVTISNGDILKKKKKNRGNA
jgi:hypothetical protein